MATTNLHDEHGERINVAADWLIDRMDEWRIGMLPSYQRMCQAIRDNAQSIRNLNRPGNTNGAVDVGILTLVDRIGALLYDDYFVTVTGKTRIQLARYKVNTIRGAAKDRHDTREPQTQAEPERERMANRA